MNSRGILYGFVGAVVGALATYLIMDRLHSQEIMDLYNEMDRMQDAMDEAGVVLFTIDEEVGEIVAMHPVDEDEAPTDEPVVHEVAGLKLHRFTDGGSEVSVQYDKVGVAGGGEDRLIIDGPGPVRLASEDSEEDEQEPAPEEDDPVRTNLFNGIFTIRGDEVSDRMVVGTFDHDDGSFEIDRKLSLGDASAFDDIIENDQLRELISEDAYDTIMDSREPADLDKPQYIHVRNNDKNLDFVIRY